MFSVELRQRYTNMLLDRKTGEDIGTLLRTLADEGCLSGGDTIRIIDHDEENEE